MFVCLFVCLAVQPNSENLAVQPNHEKPIFHEVGFAQNTISKTGNSLQVMGYTQNLRWVSPNEKGHAQSITNLTGNRLGPCRSADLVRHSGYSGFFPLYHR